MRATFAEHLQEHTEKLTKLKYQCPMYNKSR